MGKDGERRSCTARSGPLVQRFPQRAKSDSKPSLSSQRFANWWLHPRATEQVLHVLALHVPGPWTGATAERGPSSRPEMGAGQQGSAAEALWLMLTTRTWAHHFSSPWRNSGSAGTCCFQHVGWKRGWQGEELYGSSVSAL